MIEQNETIIADDDTFAKLITAQTKEMLKDSVENVRKNKQAVRHEIINAPEHTSIYDCEDLLEAIDDFKRSLFSVVMFSAILKAETDHPELTINQVFFSKLGVRVHDEDITLALIGLANHPHKIPGLSFKYAHVYPGKLPHANDYPFQHQLSSFDIAIIDDD